MPSVHRIILSIATIVVFLATTGLPVTVSFCCGELVEQAAPDRDDCCTEQAESDDTCADPACCETLVTICKLNASTVVPHAAPSLTPLQSAIAMLPVDGSLRANVRLSSPAHRNRDWYAQPPPNQSVLSVFLI